MNWPSYERSALTENALRAQNQDVTLKPLSLFRNWMLHISRIWWCAASKVGPPIPSCHFTSLTQKSSIVFLNINKLCSSDESFNFSAALRKVLGQTQQSTKYKVQKYFRSLRLVRVTLYAEKVLNSKTIHASRSWSIQVSQNLAEIKAQTKQHQQT